MLKITIKEVILDMELRTISASINVDYHSRVSVRKENYAVIYLGYLSLVKNAH
jgi:hypothetical protein